ncbi:hypothetical protein LJC27_00450 [Christensenellaceae bacterium OttesenSCG-928-M15]|nr:hypothetical protein [Christensenellaceae bacterium OttesenSCG-928-M15]
MGVTTKLSPSIRVKIIRTVALMFIGMFVLLYYVSYNSMLKLLEERENDNMRNQVLLAESILQSSVNYLPSVTRDWSSWDLTYDYIEGNYDEFLDEYLTEYPFQLFRLNFLTILDADGRVVYEQFYDFWNSEFMEQPPDLTKLYEQVNPATMASFQEDQNLDLTDTTQIGRVGFIHHAGNVYYLSSYPVIHSDETGPCVGSFIFGRIIDQTEMEFLTSNAGMSFSILPLSSLTMSENDLEELISNGTHVVTKEGDISAYTVFPGFLGENDLLVTYSSPRTLYEEGRTFINGIIGVIALCCIGVLVGILQQLNSIVVKPLGSLVNDVDKVNLDTVDGKTEAQGKNREMDNLATSVNAMLARIKSSRDEIDEKNKELYFRANFDFQTA